MKREKDSLGRLYPRRHRKQTDLNAKLTQDLGLPHDTLFIFRRRQGEAREERGNEEEGEKKDSGEEGEHEH